MRVQFKFMRVHNAEPTHKMHTNFATDWLSGRISNL